MGYLVSREDFFRDGFGRGGGQRDGGEIRYFDSFVLLKKRYGEDKNERDGVKVLVLVCSMFMRYWKS